MKRMGSLLDAHDKKDKKGCGIFAVSKTKPRDAQRITGPFERSENESYLAFFAFFLSCFSLIVSFFLLFFAGFSCPLAMSNLLVGPQLVSLSR